MTVTFECLGGICYGRHISIFYGRVTLGVFGVAKAIARTAIRADGLLEFVVVCRLEHFSGWMAVSVG